MLNGKHVLVTGGGRGIGRDVCTFLAAAGAVVVSASIEHDPSMYRVQLDEGSVTEAFLDVRNEPGVVEFFERVENDGLAITALINCAGIGIFKSIQDLTLNDWDRVLSTNLTGTFLCCREAVKRMKVHGGGRIINIGSISGVTALDQNAAYGCSKAAVQMLTNVINVESAQYGVLATTITLGAVYTEIWRDRPDFSPADMLAPRRVSTVIGSLLALPLEARVDQLTLLPRRGVL